MSLLDDLRKAGQEVDTQFLPASNELQQVLGALVYYAEHGKEFLQAADEGADQVNELLAPPAPEPSSPEPAPAAASPSDAGEASDDDIEKQISDLQAQLATRRATAQQTTVEHETGGGES